MQKVIEVRHRVAIAGRVSDTVAHRSLAGAMVTIIEMPKAAKHLLAARATQYGVRWSVMVERLDRTRTAADGLFYFLDLPDGRYIIGASLARFGKRYGAAQGSVTVSRDPDGNVNLPFLEIGLQPTTVQGKVTGAGKSTVTMAEIRVKGSGERAFTDSQGRYVLACIEPGKRTILAGAQGYQTVAKSVAIEQPGILATVNFALVREVSG